jgi:hypothetical protein
MGLNDLNDFFYQNFISVRGYWVFGLCPLTAILKKTAFWKLGLFPSSAEGEGGTYFAGAIR